MTTKKVRTKSTSIQKILEFATGLNRKMLARRLHGIEFFSKIPLAELEAAVAAGFAALDAFHADMRAAGEAVLRQLDEQGKMGVVLAGHPYSLDRKSVV